MLARKGEKEIGDGVISDLLDILEHFFIMTACMLLIEEKCFCFVL